MIILLYKPAYLWEKPPVNLYQKSKHPDSLHINITKSKCDEKHRRLESKYAARGIILFSYKFRNIRKIYAKCSRLI